MRIISNDWGCRYEDAGYDVLITSLAPQMLEQEAFLTALNAAGTQAPMTGAVVFDTANAIRTQVMSVGHATNVAKLL